MGVSVPNVPLIKAHSVPLQERPDFLLEGHFTVVYFLLGYIGDDGVFVRFADRKTSVAGLPAEIAVTFFPHYLGGACFQAFNQVSQGDRSRKTKKQMNMVGHAAYLERLAILAM